MHKFPDKRPTLHDVARRAGVSASTVSRCVTVPDKVKSDVRTRVNAIIAELGYTPHGSARALVSRRTNTVGAVIPTLENAIFATVAQALQIALSDSEKTLLLASSDYDSGREISQVEKLLARGIDGIMLTGLARDESIYNMLNRYRVDYVCTYTHAPKSQHPTIGFDNEAAMAKIVSYLHDLGHRSFAMIAGVTRGNDRAVARVKGVVDALKVYGLEINPEKIIEMPYSIANGQKALRQIWSESNRPTAIICGNDILAIGAIFEAAANSIEIPRDLSITGFDDLNLADEVTPSLTTIRAPLKEMGKLAGRFLSGEKSIADPVVHIELAADLIVRNSTGRARVSERHLSS